MLTTMRAARTIALCSGALFGCSSLLGVHDFPSDASGDGIRDAIGDGGLPDVPTACDPSQSFGTAHLIDELDAASADTFITDIDALGTTIYFASTRMNELQLFSAHRNTPSDPFGLISPLALSSPTMPWISVSPDALTGVFATEMPTGDRNLFEVSRNPDDSYKIGDALPFNSGGIEDTPRLTRDGKTLYLSSDQGGASTPHLYVSRTPFTSARLVEGVDLATANERAPALTADELVMYFTRGRTTKGTGDIFMVKRPDRAANFDNPTKVRDGISTTADEIVGAVSPDGCALYFTRFDDTATPHAHPYVANKLPP